MRYEMPSNLPDRVVKFWRLQKPRKHHTLISLLRFYHVRGLETWKEDLRDVSDDETDTDNPSSSTPSLEDIVAENPLLALSALAEVLELNFESIKLNMEILETLDAVRAGQKSRGVKREAIVSEAQGGSPTQHQTTRRKVGHTSPGVLRSPGRDAETVFVGGVPISPSMISNTSPSLRSHVGWQDALAPTPPRQVIRDQSPPDVQARVKTDTGRKTLSSDVRSSKEQNALPLQVRPKSEKDAGGKTSFNDLRSPREQKSSAYSSTQPLSDLSLKKDKLGKYSTDRSSG